MNGPLECAFTAPICFLLHEVKGLQFLGVGVEVGVVITGIQGVEAKDAAGYGIAVVPMTRNDPTQSRVALGLRNPAQEKVCRPRD